MNATKTTLTVFALVAALAVVGLGVAPALIQPAEATLGGFNFNLRDFLNENNQENEDESCENDEGIISCVHQGSGDDDIKLSFEN